MLVITTASKYMINNSRYVFLIPFQMSFVVSHRSMWKARTLPSRFHKKSIMPRAFTMNSSSCCLPVRMRIAYY